MLILATALILLAGMAIGATGIGGVLVVPVLTLLSGLGVAESIAASSFAYLFTGVAAVVQQERQAGIASRAIALLYGCAFAGAVGGAILSHGLAPDVVRWFVAALAIASGVHALVTSAADQTTTALPRGGILGGLGALVGCGSALSGTGGPVLLLPAFMLIGVPIRYAVTAAQGIQLPVAVAATGVHAAAGRLDTVLGLSVAGALLAGWWLGNRLKDRLPTHRVRHCVAAGLIVTGLWYGISSI